MNINDVVSVKVNDTHIIVRGAKESKSKLFGRENMPVATIVEIDWAERQGMLIPYIPKRAKQITDGTQTSIVDEETLKILSSLLKTASSGDVIFPWEKPSRIWVVGEKFINLPKMPYLIVGEESVAFSEIGNRIPYSFDYCMIRALENGAEALVFSVLPPMVLNFLNSRATLIPVGVLVITKRDDYCTDIAPDWFDTSFSHIEWL